MEIPSAFSFCGRIYYLNPVGDYVNYTNLFDPIDSKFYMKKEDFEEESRVLHFKALTIPELSRILENAEHFVKNYLK